MNRHTIQRWPFHALILYAVASLSTRERMHAQNGREVPNIAGTYEVMICRRSCVPQEAGEVLTRGYLVLEPGTFPLSSLPDRAQQYFRRYTAFLALGEGEGPPNACFVFDSPASTGVATRSEPVGVTRWKRDSADSIQIRLLRRTHTSYTAQVSVHGDELHGRGDSWNWRSGDGRAESDVVEGRRVGPADRNRCIRAAEARMTSLRSQAP